MRVEFVKESGVLYIKFKEPGGNVRSLGDDALVIVDVDASSGELLGVEILLLRWIVEELSRVLG